MLIMRDSINASLIPTDTPVVAGYGDGSYEWSIADWQRFPETVNPQSPLVIVISAQNIGDILDVETGDALPSEVPGWRDRFNRPSRRKPTIYCNRSTWKSVFTYVGNTVDYWIATLDGTSVIDPIYVPDNANSPVAIQTVDTGAYDESVILDPTWVNRRKIPRMYLFENSQGTGYLAYDNGLIQSLPDAATGQAYKNAGIPDVGPLSDTYIATLLTTDSHIRAAILKQEAGTITLNFPNSFALTASGTVT